MARLGGKPFYELRVHGVAGTPPAAMLGLRPVFVEPQPNACGASPRGKDPEITVSSRPPDEPDLLAYSWSSLTSGSRRTAFYVLLLPYVLANIAGWMMVPLQPDGVTLADPDAKRSWPLRVVALLVRLCGLLVTVIFALTTLLLVADLGAYQWLVGDRRWPAWLVGAGVLAAAGVVLLLFHFTRVQPRKQAKYDRKTFWQNRTDPVGYAWLHAGQDTLWDSPGIIVHLQRLHLAAAWATVALVAGLARPWTQGSWQAWDRAAVALAIAALALPVLLVSAVTLGRGAQIPSWVSGGIRWVSWSLALSALLVSAARISGIGGRAPGQYLPAIRGSTGWVALAYLLLVLAAGLVGWCARSRRDVCRRAAWNLPGCLLLAAATGTGLGAGLALQATRLLGRSRACQRLEASDRGCTIVVGPSGDWFAIMFTTVLGAIGFVLLIRFLAAYGKHRTATPRVMVAVRAVLDRASWLLAMVASLGGLAIAAGLIVAAINGRLPSASLPRWAEVVITVLLLAPVVVVAFWLTGRVQPARMQAGAILALIAFTVVAVLQGWRQEVLGLSVPPRTFLELAQLVALLLPTTIVATRFIYAGLENRDVRRGVGILWDIGTFWPRWFHPFAPPTYSDR